MCGGILSMQNQALDMFTFQPDCTGLLAEGSHSRQDNQSKSEPDESLMLYVLRDFARYSWDSQGLYYYRHDGVSFVTEKQKQKIDRVVRMS